MEQPLCTEKPSAALKNSWQAGLDAEEIVIADLIEKGCQIVAHRLKTPFAEIDILFRSQKGMLVLLEVKTLSKWEWMENRVSRRQKERLHRAAVYLQSRFNEQIQICGAFVIKKKIFYTEI